MPHAMPRPLVIAAAAIVLTSVPGSAHAGWSAVGGDRNTRRVGAAGASCIASIDNAVSVIPDLGAVSGDGVLNSDGVDRAADLLRTGQSVDTILQALQGTFEPEHARRQYGVFALAEFSSPGAYTGAMAPTWAGDGQIEGVTVQASRVVDETVVDALLAPFVDEPAECPFTFADRLMASVEAGAASGGDTLCAPDQVARTAYLIVARPSDDAESPELEIIVEDQGLDGPNPVEILRQRYDEWRAANPPDDSECTGGTGTTGAVGTGGSDGGTTGVPPATGTGSSTSGGSSTGEVGTTGSTTVVGPTDEGGSSTGDSGLPPGKGGDVPGGGACTCTSGHGAETYLSPFVLLLFARRRKRACP